MPSNVKQGQIPSDKRSNLTLSLIEYIKQHNKLPDFWETSNQRDYYLRPLKVANVIQKKGYGVWSVDWNNWIEYQKQGQIPSDKQGQKSGKGYQPLVRGHGFQFYINVPKRIDWSRRLDILKKMNVAYTPLDGNAWKFRLLGHKVWFAEEGIILYFPEGLSYYGKEAKNTTQQAMFECDRVMRRISNLSGLDFSDKGRFLTQLDKRHQADVEHELAIKYNNDKDKLKVIDESGKVWLLIDFSDHKNEFEYVDPKKCDEDHDKAINPIFNDLRQHYYATKETILLTDILKAINGLVEDRQFFAQNMISHVKAVQEIAEGIRLFKQEVKKMNVNRRKLSDWK